MRHCPVNQNFNCNLWASVALILALLSVNANAAQPQIEWRMDEQRWNGSVDEIVDSSGNGNDASAVDDLNTIQGGQICRAGAFDGVNDYIESADIASYLTATSSLSFWIRTTQIGNDRSWKAPGVTGIEVKNSTKDIFWGWLDANGRIGITVGNKFSTKSTIAINDGNYHHVVLTRDSGSGAYKIYLDGVLNRSGASASGVIGKSFSSIGRIEDTGGTPAYFEGDLDEILVFDAVLSDGEVTAIYTKQSAGLNLDGSTRNCVLAWFQLDAAAGVWNGSAGEIVDQSGNFTGGFALGTGAGVDSVPAQVCRGIDVPSNNSNGLQYGFDSGVDIDDDVGNRGTLSFWYNSNTNWVGGLNRMLADASPDDLPGANKYFYVSLRNDGRLLFSLEDSTDQGFALLTNPNNISAGVWVHIAVTWNMNGNREIYIDGALAASQNTSTSGQIGALRTLYLGDNRSTYHPGGTQRSADGIIDEVRIYNFAQTAAEIIIDRNVTRVCEAGTGDHLSIAHDGMAINCQAENITISAHALTGPHDIETAYTGAVGLSVDTAHGDWSYVSGGSAANLSSSGNGSATYVFDGSENGSVVLALANAYAEMIDINVSDGTLDEASGSADASDDPPLTYAPAGFTFLANDVSSAIGTQISGKGSSVGYGAQELKLEAINTNPLTGACEAALTGVVTVEMGFECENANTCQRPLYLGATAPSTRVDGTDTNVVNPLVYSNVPLDFGLPTDTAATFVLNYPDAGQIQLHARFALPESQYMLGTSNSFVVRPFGFNVNVPHLTPPHATTHAGNRFTSAGKAFSVSAAGVLWNSADDNAGGSDGIPDNHDDDDPSNNTDLTNNTVTLGGIPYSGTPNFGQESEGIELTARLFAPVGGTDPGLPANTLISSFSGGEGLNAGVIFKEVGIIEIAADIADLDYLGIGAAETARMKSKSGHVGRFFPHYLSITSSVNGDFANANASGVVPFTYIGQDFGYAATRPSFVVSAFSALDTLTANYTDSLNAKDDWAKLGADSVLFVAPSADASQNGADVVTPIPMTVSYTEDPQDFLVLDNGDGTYGFEFRDDTFSYNKDANSQVIPFESDINLVIAKVTDTDGVVTSAGKTLSPTPVDLRFGRLRMENAYGSELVNLIMHYHLEYFDLIGTRSFWTRHDDQDTMVAPGDIDEVPGNTAATAINPSLLPGKFEITLSAPLVEVVETITNQVDASGQSWLQHDWDGDGLFDNNPSALATFGIYDGDPVQIFIQQIYQ